MLAATRGVKSEAIGVVDFMPRDSVPWMKRERRKKKGITTPEGQAAILKHAFGFR